VGNSRVFRSAADQFNFGPDDHFELVDIDLEWAMADGTPGEFSGSIFLYPSGRTVTQAPELKRAKIGPIVATTDANGIATFRVVVVDDPNQEVASVEFTTKGAIDETTTPPTVTEGQTIQFEKSHVNQNLGLARWTAPYACTGVYNPETGKWECEDALIEGTLTLRKAQNYDVDFIAGETSVIIGRYALSGSGSGRLTKVEDDEPVLLGTRLSSADGGATWNMEVAIADLGAWVTSVNYRFLETNGPAPLQQETPLYLVRQEGNLKVFTNKVAFDGNPKGSDYQGLIFQFGILVRALHQLRPAQKPNCSDPLPLMTKPPLPHHDAEGEVFCWSRWRAVVQAHGLFTAGQTIIGADRHLSASLRPLVASLQAHEALVHQTDTLLQALDVMLHV
jgi:hypothetical protein